MASNYPDGVTTSDTDSAYGEPETEVRHATAHVTIQMDADADVEPTEAVSIATDFQDKNVQIHDAEEVDHLDEDTTVFDVPVDVTEHVPVIDTAEYIKGGIHCKPTHEAVNSVQCEHIEL
jgi:hypothetical protein